MHILGVALGLSCLGVVALVGSAHAQSQDGGLVLLQLDTLEVEPQRPGQSGSWDSAEEKSGNNCRLLAGVVSFLGSPVAGGLTSMMCNASSGGKQQQKDSRAPDLVVRLTTGTGETYHTPVARDSYSHDFGYRILVPLDAIPAHGLKLAVIDQDGDQANDGELLGSFRLRREDLLDGQLHILKQGSVKSLELSATPYVAVAASNDFVVEAGKGLTTTSFPVIAGQVIEVQASGEIEVVSSLNFNAVSPEGYASGRKVHNLPMEPLKSGPHAAAVALVAADESAIGGIVAGKCSTFVSAFTGNLILGANDTDASNNSGEFLFGVRTLAVSAKDWNNPGARLPCGKPERLAKGDIAAGMDPVRTKAASCGTTLAANTLVQAKIQIGGDGKVSSADVTGGTPELRQCISEAVTMAEFKPSEKGASITYPFVFKPQLTQVVARIRGKYMDAIKRCHQRVLKVDPNSHGQVTVGITVGPTGRVTKAKVRGFDSTVDSCIQGQAAQWRFEAPKDAGKPTSLELEIPLLLKPGA